MKARCRHRWERAALCVVCTRCGQQRTTPPRSGSALPRPEPKKRGRKPMPDLSEAEIERIFAASMRRLGWAAHQAGTPNLDRVGRAEGAM